MRLHLGASRPHPKAWQVRLRTPARGRV